MNHKHHKFATTAIVFVMMVIGAFVATRFNDVNLGLIGITSISLLLVNALLSLIILGIMLQIKESITEKNKKKS